MYYKARDNISDAGLSWNEGKKWRRRKLWKIEFSLFSSMPSRAGFVVIKTPHPPLTILKNPIFSWGSGRVAIETHFFSAVD